MKKLLILAILLIASISHAQVTKLDNDRIGKSVTVEYNIKELRARIKERNDFIDVLRAENDKDKALIAEAKAAGVDPTEEEAPVE